eukprot:SM000163S02302  [mRNA]  locus=s163:8170:17087:- [translate_table: standard]
MEAGLAMVGARARGFWREKVNALRLAVSSVSTNQLLAEKATNADAWGPESRVMGVLVEACRQPSECRRIMSVVYQRLALAKKAGGQHWREVLKALTLLEYLIIHGPDSIQIEWTSEMVILEENCRFAHHDQRGFDLGQTVRCKATTICNMLNDPQFLQQERVKGERVRKEMQGFGATPSAFSRSTSFDNVRTASAESLPVISRTAKSQPPSPLGGGTSEDDLDDRSRSTNGAPDNEGGHLNGRQLEDAKKWKAFDVPSERGWSPESLLDCHRDEDTPTSILEGPDHPWAVSSGSPHSQGSGRRGDMISGTSVLPLCGTLNGLDQAEPESLPPLPEEDFFTSSTNPSTNPSPLSASALILTAAGRRPHGAAAAAAAGEHRSGAMAAPHSRAVPACGEVAAGPSPPTRLPAPPSAAAVLGERRGSGAGTRQSDVALPPWSPQRQESVSRRESLQKGENASWNGNMGKYMEEKNRKLREQYKNNQAGETLFRRPAETDIFQGVTIWVNGYTIPPHQELRHLMMCHGGLFENYYSRERVTHIVCANLPDGKLKEYRKMWSLPPIVKPGWVTDSIKAGTLLPASDYQLERLAYDHPGQRNLSGFLKEKTASVQAQNGQEVLRGKGFADIFSERESELVNGHLTDALESTPSIDNVSPQHAGNHFIGQESPAQTNEQLPVYSRQKPPSERHKEGDDSDQQRPQGHSDYCPGRMSNAGPSLIMEDNEGDREPVSNDVAAVGKNNSDASASSGLFVQPRAPRSRSTQDDPNFIQNYYKYSRLHFIGTWRNRYLNSRALAADNTPSSTIQVKEGPPAIIHIDMDCFFVSAVIRHRPELASQPVAVCHSDNANGSAEISSANYSARTFGISAGMFMREAKRRCPSLVVVPYDFEGYQKVADTLYEILHRYTDIVQASSSNEPTCHTATEAGLDVSIKALSCDEAFLDVTGLGDPEAIAHKIRHEIFENTGCTASAGVASNPLLARLATRRAKPNGLFYLPEIKVAAFMSNLAVADLHGVGWNLQEKLRAKGIDTCSELRARSKEWLRTEFGMKTGDMLYFFARGEDNRPVQAAQDRKSMGAEVNWGIRFKSEMDGHTFLEGLVREVCARLAEASMKGRTFTIKAKKRKPGAQEPSKFMGCGWCDNLSRSATLGTSTNSLQIVQRVAKQLWDSLRLDPLEVRGMGLQVTRLEHLPPAGSAHLTDHSMHAFISPSIEGGEVAEISYDLAPPSVPHTLAEGVETAEAARQLAKSGTLLDSNFIPVMGQAVQQVGITISTPAPLETPCDLATSCTPKLIEIPPSTLELPPRVSQLDQSVITDLPSDILLELKAIYPSLPDASPAVHTIAVPVTSPSPGSGDTKSDFVDKVESVPDIPDITGNEGLILALPPASQLDQEVLDALPLPVRRELELAYMDNRQTSMHPRLHSSRGSVSPPNREAAQRHRGKSTRAGAVVSLAKRQKTLFQVVKDQKVLSPEAGHPQMDSAQQNGSVMPLQANPDNKASTFITESGKNDDHMIDQLPTELQIAQPSSPAEQQYSPLTTSPRGQRGVNVMSLQMANDSLETKAELQAKQDIHHSPACYEQATGLWQGDPPEWVQLLQSEEWLIGQGSQLQALLGSYCQDSRQSLSQALACLPLAEHQSKIEPKEQLVALLEQVVLQYVQGKVESDLEEIYFLMRRLRRLADVDPLWNQVEQHARFPVQVLVCDVYGGPLVLS